MYRAEGQDRRELLTAKYCAGVRRSQWRGLPPPYKDSRVDLVCHRNGNIELVLHFTHIWSG